MGNSEVGHLNLGAGRVVSQDLVRIGESIRDGSFFENRAFVGACDNAVRTRRHGSPGRPDRQRWRPRARRASRSLSSSSARGAACRASRIHALLDGRDTMPRSALGYMRELLGDARPGRAVGRQPRRPLLRHGPRQAVGSHREVVSRGGSRRRPDGHRSAARDQRGLRTERNGRVRHAHGDRRDGEPVATMRDGDAVICFNFRADRMRQIVRALTDPSFDEFDVSGRPSLHVATMTPYDETFDVPVAFPPADDGEHRRRSGVQAGMTQLRTAETEKYAHVTYFFNGGSRRRFQARIACSSPARRSRRTTSCPR